MSRTWKCWAAAPSLTDCRLFTVAFSQRLLTYMLWHIYIYFRLISWTKFNYTHAHAQERTQTHTHRVNVKNWELTSGEENNDIWWKTLPVIHGNLTILLFFFEFFFLDKTKNCSFANWISQDWKGVWFESTDPYLGDWCSDSNDSNDSSAPHKRVGKRNRFSSQPFVAASRLQHITVLHL